MRHGEVGAIELQHEPGRGDRLVFLLHRRAHRFDIGLVGGIELVGLERGDEAGRGRGHERFRRRRAVERRAQIGDVGANGSRSRIVTGPTQVARRIGCTPVIRLHRRVEVGIVLDVERRRALAAPGEAAEPIGDIGRIAGLRHLAVIDDVDADRDAGGAHRGDRVGDAIGKPPSS